ncbi:MAG: RNase P modulator RnpM [Dehalococcoidia bacterium]
MVFSDNLRGHGPDDGVAPKGAKSIARSRQPQRVRPVPQRTCIACRSTSAKREFVRLVRTSEGHVEVDPTGKKAGRGAYLCMTAACWELALKKERLNAALKLKLAAEDAARLRDYASRLPSS